jgi:hypothetical protein
VLLRDHTTRGLSLFSEEKGSAAASPHSSAAVQRREGLCCCCYCLITSFSASATAVSSHCVRVRSVFQQCAICSKTNACWCCCLRGSKCLLSAGAAVCAEANACCLLVLLSAPKQMPAAVCCWCGASINALSLSLCEWSPLLCCLLLLPLPFWLLSIWVVGVFLSRLLLVWCFYRCSLSLCLSVSGARYFAVCCCYPCPSGFFQYGSLVCLSRLLLVWCLYRCSIDALSLSLSLCEWSPLLCCLLLLPLPFWFLSIWVVGAACCCCRLLIGADCPLKDQCARPAPDYLPVIMITYL